MLDFGINKITMLVLLGWLFFVQIINSKEWEKFDLVIIARKNALALCMDNLEIDQSPSFLYFFFLFSEIIRSTVTLRGDIFHLKGNFF